jgi:hypothetical protein
VLGVKNDRWIREMAIKHKMIEPFEERLVRKGVISYGLSSYGYDMRLADEFLIFTNVWGAIVDPKAFDERAFVRHRGDYCIIPPNSFVLGRSVEYFRIPRDVICIVVGKSSYARCFSGDTRVALVDGTAPTLEEMAQRWERGERFFGYSVGPFGRIIVTELVAPRYIGRDSLLEITLDNGQKIHCTPDHLFLTRDGLMVPAADLRPGDRLMPLYRRVFQGYEMVYQPLTDATTRPIGSPTSGICGTAFTPICPTLTAITLMATAETTCLGISLAFLRLNISNITTRPETLILNNTAIASEQLLLG